MAFLEPIRRNQAKVARETAVRKAKTFVPGQKMTREQRIEFQRRQMLPRGAEGRIGFTEARRQREAVQKQALATSPTIGRFQPGQAAPEIGPQIGPSQIAPPAMGAPMGASPDFADTLGGVPRPEPTVATPEKPIITRGEFPTPVKPDDQIEEEIAVKKAKNIALTDDELKYQFRKEKEKMAPSAAPVEGGLSFTMEQFLNETDPSKIQMMQQEMFDKQALSQRQMLEEQFGRREEMLGQRVAEQQAAIDAARSAGNEEVAKALEPFKAETQAEAAEARRQVELAGAGREEQLKEMQSFAGFGRSTKTAEILDKSRADTQAQVADIERQSGRAIREYQASLLDKVNARVEQMENRLMQTQDAQDELALNKIEAEGKLMADLFAQNPSNPDNMLKVAQQLRQTKIEEMKVAAEEEKELRKDARDNFQFMVQNFGSGYIQNMNDEEVATLAHNLQVPAGALKAIGPTMKEYEQAWEQAKYAKDQEFDLLKIGLNQDFQARMADLDYSRDLEKLGINFEYDTQKMYLDQQFKDAADQKKYSGLSYGEYAAAGSAADGAAIYYEGGVQGPGGTQLIGYNPKLGNAYPNGYQKEPSSGSRGLGGQCAYEAQQLTTCPAVGSYLQDKINSVAKYVKQGKAFYPGQETGKVGNTIITNESKKYGHAAVIIGITADGKYQLGEFNRGGDLRFTNTRTIDPNDKRIIGVIKSEPKPQYKVAKDASKLAQDAVNKNPIAKMGAGLASKTLLGQLFGAVGKGIMEKAGMAPVGGGLPGQGGISSMVKGIGGAIGGLKQGAQQQRALQEAISRGEIDEQGRTLTSARQAVRTGAYSDSQLRDMYEEIKGAVNAGYLPKQDLDLFNQDLIYAKQRTTTSPGTQFTQENALRDEFLKNTETFRKVRDSYQTIQAGIENPNAVTDLSLIFAYMKLLDPGSVVREGEFANAQNAAGVQDQVRNAYNQVRTGERLNPQQRAAFLTQAKNIYNQQALGYEQARKQTQSLAQQYGLDPNRVVYDYSVSSPSLSPSAPSSSEYSGGGYGQLLQGGGGMAGSSTLDYYSNRY